jgi:lysophospholipase L1-like esterase
MRANRWIQSFGVFLDRLYKMNMLRFVRASVKRGFSDRGEKDLNRVDSEFGPILFLQGARANKEVPEEKLNQAIQTIKGYHDLFKSQGIRFIFLTTPEKETVFYKSLGTPRPVFLEQLTARLKQLGVEIVDTQQAFEEAFQKDSVLLYQRDDTHWNGNGVRIAADLLAKVIEEKKNVLPHS